MFFGKLVTRPFYLRYVIKVKLSSLFRFTIAFCSVALCTHTFATTDTIIERYTVTSERAFYDDTLERIFPQYRYHQANIVTPNHINDILLQSPSVNLNGQGGQLQNINIRGFSRWRVQSLLDGVPVISDRRAGSSVGFVPPSLIESVSVVPGATSTYLGSGAIGGAVNLHFGDFIEPHVRLSLSDNQHMQEYSYADALGSMDWHVSHRHGANGEDANGRELFDGFEQTSFFLRHRSEDSAVEEAWALYSDNRDIGKSSSDFPNDRITIYPQNKHFLGKLRFSLSGDDQGNNDIDVGVKGSVWWHHNTLDTNTLRPEQRINESNSEALDFGASIGSKALVGHWLTNWQLQMNSREGVITDEREFSLPSESLAYDIRTLDASELNLAGVLDASRTFESISIAGGGRVDWQQQSHLSNDVTNTNVSAFAGVSYAISSRFSASVYLSSAFRNPSLTERFFNGETPRGTVLGDTTLATEKATNVQATLYFSDDAFTGSIELFHQRINDYIERKNVVDSTGEDTDTLQYQNLDSATIEGVTYQLAWRPSQSPWGAQIAGAWTQGEDDDDVPVADIPAHNQRLTVSYDKQQWRWFGSVIYRASKRDVADGERPLDSVTTLDMGITLALSPRLTVNTSIQNVSNQLFYASTDDRAAFAQGRRIQLGATLLL